MTNLLRCLALSALLSSINLHAGISDKALFPDCGVYQVSGRIRCEKGQSFCILKMQPGTLSEFALRVGTSFSLRKAEGLRVQLKVKLQEDPSHAKFGILTDPKVHFLGLNEPLTRPMMVQKGACQ